MCRNPYDMRWNLLWRAFRDDPGTVLKGGGDIIQWLRSAIWVRRQ